LQEASDFRAAEAKIAAFEYDIILLDISLPHGNGLDLLRQLKAKTTDTGVIIISAKNALDDKIGGLELGADDYMAKPIHLAELQARINALWRRKMAKGATAIEFGVLTIDTEAKQVFVNKEALTLTKKEFQLLLYFVVNQNKVVTREAIAEHLWGDFMESADDFDFVYTHIKNLRKKLKAAGCPDYLKSVYGMGYKMTLS
jgi:DNA-binding response OmpR family regulator